ncbi:unnamed protein product, partial [Choristocarpus tenellus]
FKNFTFLTYCETTPDTKSVMIRLLDPYAFSLSLLVGMVGFGMNFFFNTNVSTWRINEIGYPLAGMVYVYIRNARFFPETEDSATGGNGGTENDDIKTEIKQPASPLDDLGSRLVVGQPLSRPSKGELVVVFFWASWCSNSIKFLPGLLATAARYREEGVAFLGVSQESEEDLRDFVEGYSRPLKGVPLSADDRGSLTRAYQVPHGVNTIPHAYVIRGEGAGSNGGGSKG